MPDAPNLEELKQMAISIVHEANENGKLSLLTVKVVREKIEACYGLEAGTLDTKDYRRPLREVITTAAKEGRTQKKAKIRDGETNDQVPQDIFSYLDNDNESLNKDPTLSANAQKNTSSRHKKRRKVATCEYKSAEILESSDGGDEPSVDLPSIKGNNPHKRTFSSGSKEDLKQGGSDDQCHRKHRRLSAKKERDSKKREKVESKVPCDVKTKPVHGTSKELSKDEGTVVRLKSLVSACGVRKTWSKVFLDCNMPSQKIKKLKQILADLGMMGRYSLEQARRIKSQRELAQELEDVQTFERLVVHGDKTESPSEDSDSASVDQAGEKNSKPIQPKLQRTALESISAFLDDQSNDN